MSILPTLHRFVRSLSRPSRPGEPDFARPVSQLCTQAQTESFGYAFWCEAIGETPRPHRKQWEYCYILQALATRGVLAPEMRGVGFGVGGEPLTAVIASRGAQVLATDVASHAALEAGWSTTGQHAAALEDLNRRDLCPAALFERLVSFQVVDMNAVALERAAFDFTWSACALEHLGSIHHGGRFILNSLELLRPGGVAVHTTEYNLLDDGPTVDNEATVLFRRRDLLRIMARARRRGFNVQANWSHGSGELDRHIDLPPYTADRHLKLKIGAFPTTSIGLIFQAPGALS